MRWLWDGFVLDLDARRLTGDGAEIHLEPQALGVLHCLVSQADRAVSKAELLDTVWGDQFVSESALTTRIKQARRALGDDGRTQKYIRSVHGHGYRFVGELTSGSERGLGAESPQPEPVALHLALDIAVDDEFPFVGRANELEQVGAVLEAGLQSNGHVFVGGYPGAGKSRLAVELLERSARDGTMVCAGRCEATVTSSLQAVRDAFRQLAATHPSRVGGWARGIEGQMVSLMPSLVSFLPHEPLPVDVYAGIDVLVTAFERVCLDGPVVILIDDLQWSDEPTRTFLGRLHRHLRGKPVSTVSTFRSGREDLPDEVYQWIQRQRRAEDSAFVTLAELDDQAARQLVQAVAGDTAQSDTDHVISTTAGHCLFLTETLRDLQLGQNTADSVADLISARVDRQDEDVQKIIRVGALLGPEFPFSVAAAAAGLGAEDALRAIDDAIEAELLHETSTASRFRFSHQLVPEAIATSLSRSSLASLHLACARALEAEGADEVEISFQILGAAPLVPIEEAVDRSRSAAVAAREANQFDRSLRLLERVVSTGPTARIRAEVLLEIGEIINAQGTPGEAISVLEQVTDSARQNGWPDLFVAAVLAHWNRSPFRKPYDASTLKLLAEADALLGDAPSVLKARVMAKTAAFNVFRQPLGDRDTASAQALDMARACDVEPGDWLELLEARAINFSCPAGVVELDELDNEIETLRGSGHVYFTDAAAPETRFLMRGLGHELRRVSASDRDRIAVQPIAEWRDLELRSTFAAFAGEFDEARELCDRGGEIGDAFWGDSSYALHAFGQFFLDMLSGDWIRSRELLELVSAFDSSHIFNAALALAHCQADEEKKALEQLELVEPSLLWKFGEHILGGNALIACAELALFLDHEDLAQASEQALQPFSDLVLGVPWACSLAAADPLARLANRRGDSAAAERYRAEARRLYAGLDAPSLMARVS